MAHYIGFWGYYVIDNIFMIFSFHGAPEQFVFLHDLENNFEFGKVAGTARRQSVFQFRFLFTVRQFV